jgi:Fe2+ or Zn2+ uptake regulation protein
VRCAHCGSISFTSQRVLLDQLYSSLNVPVPTREAHILVCTQCGRFEWFAQQAEKTSLRLPNPQAGPE